MVIQKKDFNRTSEVNNFKKKINKQTLDRSLSLPLPLQKKKSKDFNKGGTTSDFEKENETITKTNNITTTTNDSDLDKISKSKKKQNYSKNENLFTSKFNYNTYSKPFQIHKQQSYQSSNTNTNDTAFDPNDNDNNNNHHQIDKSPQQSPPQNMIPRGNNPKRSHFNQYNNNNNNVINPNRNNFIMIEIDNLPPNKTWKQIKYLIGGIIHHSNVLQIKLLPPMTSILPPFLVIHSCLVTLQNNLNNEIINDLILTLNSYTWENHDLFSYVYPPVNINNNNNNNNESFNRNLNYFPFQSFPLPSMPPTMYYPQLPPPQQQFGFNKPERRRKSSELSNVPVTPESLSQSPPDAFTELELSGKDDPKLPYPTFIPIISSSKPSPPQPIMIPQNMIPQMIPIPGIPPFPPIPISSSSSNNNNNNNKQNNNNIPFNPNMGPQNNKSGYSTYSNTRIPSTNISKTRSNSNSGSPFGNDRRYSYNQFPTPTPTGSGSRYDNNNKNINNNNNNNMEMLNPIFNYQDYFSRGGGNNNFDISKQKGYYPTLMGSNNNQYRQQSQQHQYNGNEYPYYYPTSSSRYNISNKKTANPFKQPKKLKNIFNEKNFRKQMTDRGMWQLKLNNFPPYLLPETETTLPNVTKDNNNTDHVDIETDLIEKYGKLRWTILKDFIKLKCPKLLNLKGQYNETIGNNTREFYVGVYESKETNLIVKIKSTDELEKNQEEISSEEDKFVKMEAIIYNAIIGFHDKELADLCLKNLQDQEYSLGYKLHVTELPPYNDEETSSEDITNDRSSNVSKESINDKHIKGDDDNDDDNENTIDNEEIVLEKINKLNISS